MLRTRLGLPEGEKFDAPLAAQVKECRPRGQGTIAAVGLPQDQDADLPAADHALQRVPSVAGSLAEPGRGDLLGDGAPVQPAMPRARCLTVLFLVFHRCLIVGSLRPPCVDPRIGV